MHTLVECVPNFSEGRDPQVVEAIARAALAGKDVWLLDRHLDPDHNRSVLTLVGSLECIGEAALRSIGKAAELIDLRRHEGVHPRIGATDVVPFVPISGVSLEECVRIAEWVAREAWQRFKIPTYLYEAAARRPERRHLENIRVGQFEGLRDEFHTHPGRLPDFGAALHPTAGATVVGARQFLIAFNINLNTSDEAVAKGIARKIRASSGGLPCVKAIGLKLESRGMAQVSMNLTDFQTTSVHVAFRAVKEAAGQQGVEIAGSEIVGLIPRRALEDAAVRALQLESYSPELIVENRLASVLAEQRGAEKQRALTEGFVAAVAAPVPTPGGGSVAALAGSLAAALGEMVCGVTLKRKSFHQHFPVLEEARAKLANLREKLMDRIDRDSESYQSFLDAKRLPQVSPTEQAARAEAMETAGKQAAAVPLETAELVAEVERLLKQLRANTIPQAAPDLAVAVLMAEAGRKGSLENVRANLPAIRDRSWTARVERKVKFLADSDSVA
ncbi:MAG: glutamate formimidoyltransferase [Acidobacteria bacterium]|nr:glutamate formimidoyltransferase [Acidobacteriota bacterium]